MFTAWSEIKYLATKELLPCHYQITYSLILFFIFFQNISNKHSEVGLPIISSQDNRTR